MNWPEVFKGIQLCIGFQLLLIAIFLFTSRQSRNNLLGFYTVLICISSLSSALYSFLEKIPTIAFFFSAYLIVLHAPLLFIYVKSLDNKKVNLRSHFTFPILYTLSYLALKLKFSSFFEAHSAVILMVHLFVIVLYTGIYFFYGLRYFHLELSDTLKYKALKKFRLFYVITNVHAIWLYLTMGICYLSHLFFFDRFPYFNEVIAPQIFNVIVYIHPVTSIIFITYLLSETHSLHSLVLQKGIFRSVEVKQNSPQILSEVKRLIEVEKQFKNPDFNLKLLSLETGIRTKELAEFFAEEMSISFNDFVNQKKVEEFKNLVTKDKENAYSLEGMAQMAGFNSKATFYRVFKKLEGITPAQYKAFQNGAV